MLTLRQHVARAMEILSTLGVRTILPSGDVIIRGREKKKWMRNAKRPATRPDVAGNQRDYALSVMAFIDQENNLCLDRTGWMALWLTASDETASAVWHSIPDKVICFECGVERRIADCRCQGRCQCRECQRCGRRMFTFVGVVSADLQAMARALRKGGVGVE